jgi:hypothetical protein
MQAVSRILFVKIACPVDLKSSSGQAIMRTKNRDKLIDNICRRLKGKAL